MTVAIVTIVHSVKIVTIVTDAKVQLHVSSVLDVCSVLAALIAVAVAIASAAPGAIVAVTVLRL